MEAEMLWTAALTAGLGLIGWILKSAVNEMQRLNILLNKTREEMARDKKGFFAAFLNDNFFMTYDFPLYLFRI